MKPRGDFRVSRDVFDHPALKGDTYDRVSAWLSLIADAAWTERIVGRLGRLIKLERGQIAVSHRFLSDRWKWGPDHKRVSRFLDKLLSLDMIRMHTVSGIGVITITNYELYQGNVTPGQSRDSDAPQTGTVNGTVKNRGNSSAAGITEIEQGDNGTVNGTAMPQGLAENRDKTYSHTKKESETPSNRPSIVTKRVTEREIKIAFEEWWSSVPRKVGKKSALIAYTRILKKGEATIAELLAGAKAYAVACAGKEPRYVKHPTGWLNAGRWADEIETAAPKAAKPIAWPECVALFKRRNIWPPGIGPPPDHAGCEAPRDVLVQFGFEPTKRG